MNRREFVLKTGLATGGWLACAAQLVAGGADSRIRWRREDGSPVFSSVSCQGQTMFLADTPGLLDAYCRLTSATPAQGIRLHAKQPAATQGPLQSELRHELRQSGGGNGEDVLEATLTIRNLSANPQQVELAFATSLQPVGASRAASCLRAALLRGRTFRSARCREFS